MQTYENMKRPQSAAHLFGKKASHDLKRLRSIDLPYESIYVNEQ